MTLNGRPVPQRLLGSETINLWGTTMEARRLGERFPGERRDHPIYDTGHSSGDDFAEVHVRPGHLFLLGDNRDHSADSRFPPEAAGLEQVPIANVRGRPLFFSWWPGTRDRGARIGG